MPIMMIPVSCAPCQVDIPDVLREKGKPDREVKRLADRKGAIHVRPGSRLRLSDDELEVIEKKNPTLAKQLIRVPEKKNAVAAPKANRAASTTREDKKKKEENK